MSFREREWTTYPLQVAGVCLRVHVPVESADLVHGRYRGFQTSAIASENEVNGEIWADLRSKSGAWRADEVTMRCEDERIMWTGPQLDAQLDLTTMQCRVVAPMAERAIDSVLRTVLAHALLKRGGLLAHAAAVVYEGQAHVFPAASGVGKSTIARELPGPLLGDEAIALVPDPETGEVRAFATPYWQAEAISAPLASLHFPSREGVAPGSTALTPAHATAKLWSQSGPLAPTRQEEALGAAQAICEACEHLAVICLPDIGSISSWLLPHLRSLGGRVQNC